MAHLVPSTDMKSATNIKLNSTADENGTLVVEAPKNKLREICALRKWPIPEYMYSFTSVASVKLLIFLVD